jgi:hypothetical protein
MTRKFANCTLTLNAATKEVNRVPSGSTAAIPAPASSPSASAPTRRRPLSEQLLST